MWWQKLISNLPRWENIKSRKKLIFFLLIFMGLLVWYAYCLPSQLFNDPVSITVRASGNQLLGARIARDGQWRFPPNDRIPDKFKKCIIAFEDKRFEHHIGIDFLALGRAFKLNWQKGRVVSGASTLTMQTIRLSRKGKKRTYLEKIQEILLATRLELATTKNHILALYASNAPFGGNVVGIDAAAWKYYGREPHTLTWSENATLAVLPNSPSLIHPGKNRDQLLHKRNLLLKKLHDQSVLSAEEYELALIEPLPQRPKALPNIAPHLIDRFLTSTRQLKTKKQIRTSIDYHLQLDVNRKVKLYAKELSQNGVYNAGVMVLDVQNNQVLAYGGNTPAQNKSRNNAVDMIMAKRSTGSVIKPFLYAMALEEGLILPNALLRDVPSHYFGFNPKNYNRHYLGAVPASEALSRSLNVPIVKLLHDYGYQKFYAKMKLLGMKTLDRNADHYGLSIILGGAETTLWDLSGMYAGLVRSCIDFNQTGRYRADAFSSPKIELDTTYKPNYRFKNQLISAASAYFTLNAMKEVKRPGVLASWKYFTSARKIAWKTGTSWGNRDAWAVGCTKDYVVAVWVGNADGEGRPRMTGTHTASPLLFSIFKSLPPSDSWFQAPKQDLEKTEICEQSGFLSTPNCPSTLTVRYGKSARNGTPCSYCQTLNLDGTRENQVNSSCYSISEMVRAKFFVLPPTEQYYYLQSHPRYQKTPDWLPGCRELNNSKAMEIIYPKSESSLYIPITLAGSKSQVIFEVKHRNQESLIYWHLDDEFIGTTSGVHQMEFAPKAGDHTLLLIDDLGERHQRTFKVIK